MYPKTPDRCRRGPGRWGLKAGRWVRTAGFLHQPQPKGILDPPFSQSNTLHNIDSRKEPVVWTGLDEETWVWAQVLPLGLDFPTIKYNREWSWIITGV